MANIKSQIKRVITNEKSRAANASFKSSLKTAVKDVEVAVAKQEKAVAVEALNLAYKKLDKAVSKGVFHKNFASRQKSRLTKLVNTLE
ncbi:MAG: 30S ribosomal protein S20 [Candidatus Izemoplasmatales bacterium]